MQRRFVQPNNYDKGVNDALRQMQILLRQMETPLLTDQRSLNAIAEGASAYFIENGTVFRYTKIKGKLRRENVDEGLNEEQVERIAEEEVANAPRATLTGTLQQKEGMVGEVREELFYYEVGNPPPEKFIARYYLSRLDVINENPVADEDVSRYVADPTFTPAMPNDAPGTHATIFTFRHIVEGTLIVQFGLE